MKKLFTFLSLLVGVVSLNAASGIATVTCAANTASNLLSGQYIVSKITLISTTTNMTTVKFYDSSNATTTIVTSAYTKYTGYATNVSNVFTNESGIVITNTTAGWATVPVTVAAATNTRPLVYTITGPASTIVATDVQIGTLKGLAAVPDQNCQVVVSYQGNP